MRRTADPAEVGGLHSSFAPPSSRTRPIRTVADPTVVARLTDRLRALSVDQPRQWGKMNVQQMLAHLAGSMEWVLSGGEVQTPWEDQASRLIKFIAFRVPLPWPKGIPNPNDPSSVEVPAGDFEPLRQRVIRGLEEMGRWEPSEKTPPHPAFGPLTAWEWHRWAFKHTDHHLKQFGV